uniref:Uncharacterized protein n=1 Tax=Anopheles atroparvus TaxID=41427 RepID=A0A182J966_ANOAO
LPHRGQIVHPSREIGFPGVKMPMCAVSAAQYLTTNGWAELRNPIDTDVPFRLFRDEGRIYLQWLGEPELRQRMQGRLVLVHLMCRDMTPRLLLPDGRTAPHHGLQSQEHHPGGCLFVWEKNKYTLSVPVLDVEQ